MKWTYIVEVSPTFESIEVRGIYKFNKEDVDSRLALQKLTNKNLVPEMEDLKIILMRMIYQHDSKFLVFHCEDEWDVEDIEFYVKNTPWSKLKKAEFKGGLL